MLEGVFCTLKSSNISDRHLIVKVYGRKGEIVMVNKINSLSYEMHSNLSMVAGALIALSGVLGIFENAIASVIRLVVAIVALIVILITTLSRKNNKSESVEMCFTKAHEASCIGIMFCMVLYWGLIIVFDLFGISLSIEVKYILPIVLGLMLFMNAFNFRKEMKMQKTNV